MQTTSALYKSILAGPHWFEVRVSIDGKYYSNTEIYDLRTSTQMFGSVPEIGLAVCGQIDLELNNPTVSIARMARIVPEIRAVNDTGQSEWIKKGIFYIDTRKVVVGGGQNRLHLSGFDAMLKTSQEYVTSKTFPATTKSVVEEIASRASIPVEVETLTLLSDGQTIPIKPEYYTGREVLGFIAAMYGGNFVISDDGYLRLTRFCETNYLIDEAGNRITFGGDRILV